VDAGTINGSLISSAGGQLYVNLVKTSGNTIVASKMLTNGTFSFGTADGLRNDVSTYKLVLTTTAVATTGALPTAGWVNTAEGVTLTTGDGAIDGSYTFGASVMVNTTIDFGVDARPIAVPLTTATTKVNPGGSNFIGIANALPLGSDPVDVAGGQVIRLHVISFPTKLNAVTITGSATINGVLAVTTYTAATWPVGGVYVATDASGATLDSFYVDPINGTDTIQIQFRSIDQAWVESANIGIGKIPFSDLTISGSVYDDVNGNNDGLVNGTLISNASGQLYVNLVDGNTNTVISSKAVSSGAFSFGTADGLQNDVTTYRLVLASSPAATTQGLPDAAVWVNTGEGPSNSHDGLANGRYTLSSAVTSSLVITFGIDARPVPTTLTTASSQQNPGGINTVTIPANTFSATDAVDVSGGEVNYIHITAFPSNATTVNFASAATVLNGSFGAVSYTSANFPSGGVYLVSNASGNPVAAITVDPVGGAVNVEFTYTAIDNAGIESNTSGTARQPLSDVTISGSVYDDVTGGTINGDLISSAGSQLYVNLVNTATNAVIASKLLTNGTFSFGTADGVANNIATYQLVLTTSAISTSALLPSTDWVNIAEGITATTGDGAINGTYIFGSNVTTNQVIDFAIEALPVPATLNTATTQVNPGATNMITVPANTFSGSDATDLNGGQVNYIHITSFPTNTTTISFASASTTLGGGTSALSYTSGTFPAGGVFVATNASGNPSSAIMVDPVNGVVNVDITYTAIDNTLQESLTSGTARQPLSDLLLTGNVYDDVDGGTIDGTLTSSAGGQLYVNLVNTAGNIIVASKAVTSGAFSFSTADGLRNDVATYKLVLANSALATTGTLPSSWANTAEGTPASSGDGTANGNYNFGGTITDNMAIDFGIDARPVPVALTTAIAQTNPGGTSTITVPSSTFVAADANDILGGITNYIHITSFPTNTTTVNFASAATTVNGSYGAVSYTSGTFPAGGVYLVTNTAGNPASAITVDPTDGAVNVDFTYTAIDNAGVESNTSGIARQPLADLTISGIVYNDVNAGIIDGIAISNASGQLYVNLVNTSGNTVLASKMLTDGSFSFGTADGLRSDVATYKLVLTTSPSGTTAALPTSGWVVTAEGLRASTGDGLPSGDYTFGGLIASNQVIDFGIDALATAYDATAVSQANPGGTNYATVPATTFSGTDAVDQGTGEITYVHVTSFPTNTTSILVLSALTAGGLETTNTYTAGNFPAGGIYLATDANGNLLNGAAFQVDPVNGGVTVGITYYVIDNAGKESLASATASQPFGTLTITGTLYDDYNGMTDNLLNGIATTGGGLYVNAITAGNIVAASALVANDGTYSLTGLNAGSYTLVLSSTATGTNATLNDGWLRIGEGLGSASDNNADGSLVVTLIASDLSGRNFAIERPATADDKTYVMGPNTNPAIAHTTVVSTANSSNTYAARITLAGASSSGNTPGALTGLDADGNNGSALTLTSGTQNVTLVIDPSSYSGTRNGSSYSNAMMLEYNGIQLQAGGCQGSDIGNGGCSLYNATTSKWEIPAYELGNLKMLVKNGSTTVAFNYLWKDEAGQEGSNGNYGINFEQSLPVHLVNFTGEKRGTNAQLSWTSDNEVNFQGFGVERSIDGRNFTQIGFVNGRGLSSLQRYSYSDDLRGIAATRIYYRLKQLDISGQFQYSTVVSMALDNSGAGAEVIVLTNPVKNSLRLNIRNGAATSAQIMVADNLGRVVYSSKQSIGVGTTTLSLDLPAFLANGVYHVITQIDGVPFNNKVVLDR
jgi:hypothetical protein